MSGLTNLGPIPKQQSFNTPYFNPNPDLLLNSAAPWLLPSPGTNSKKSSSKHHKKKQKQKKKKHRKQQLGAYMLQLIGVLCLILAAIKAFEPLTSVGFTLVIVGYRAGLGEGVVAGKERPLHWLMFFADGVADLFGTEKRRRKTKKRKLEERLEVEGTLVKGEGGEE